MDSEYLQEMHGCEQRCSMLQQRRLVSCCLWLLVLACGTPWRPAVKQSPELPKVPEEGLVILGGTVSAHGRPGGGVNIALVRTGTGLRVDSAGRGTVPPKTDTIDASGLYIHTAHIFRTSPTTGKGGVPLYTLRTGPSAGSPAVWRVGAGFGGRKWGRIDPAEDGPPAPPDHRVGCYDVEQGEWSDPTGAEALLQRTPTFDDLRLHWRYLWQYGRDSLLVATDAAGEVGEPYDLFFWRPLPGDSLVVHFSRGIGHESLVYRASRRGGDDYVGTITLLRAYSDSPETEVRLRRMPCPMDPQISHGNSSWSDVPIRTPLRRKPARP